MVAWMRGLELPVVARVEAMADDDFGGTGVMIDELD